MPRLTLAGLLLCGVPLVSIAELALHVKQTSSDVVAEADWARARGAVEADLRPDDLIVFEPRWSDPLGRRAFGHLATVKREGRSDVRRFPRAFEVSIRGARAQELAGWRAAKETRHGGVTVRLLENPSHTPVIDDVLELASPDRLTVSRVEDGVEQPCPFQRTSSQGGSTVVPQGLLVPAERFVCQGGAHVGVAVLHGLDHRPRVCLYATPMQRATLRLTFSDVTFGPSLFGHSGIQWLVERTPAPEKVDVTFSALGRRIGTHHHKVGAGWVGFELPTPELDGKKAALVAEIAPSSQRQFCFEATTRREVPSEER